MKIHLTIILFFLVTHSACGQVKKSGIDGLSIDPNIKSEVEKHIENSKEFEDFQTKMQVYWNSGFVETFENDSLTYKSNNKSNKVPFKSFYLGQNDTLTIDGAFGIFGAVGFDIKIVNNKATLNHMLSTLF